MGSKGSSTQQTSSTSHYQPSPQITAAGTQALQGGQMASQQPFWLPQQPVAGFSPDQLAAFQNVRNMQGMTSPWFGAAGNLAMSSAQPLTGEQIAGFYNPMAQNVTNQLQNIFGQQMREATGRATQAAGGVGADRIAVAQANLANQQGLAAGQTYSQLYQNALNAAMQNQQMQANAAYAMGNLGAGAQGAALQGTQALLGAGGLQQQMAQARLMAPYQWLGQQFAYPYQANQYLAGVTGSLVPAFPSTTTGQSTTTATPAQPSPVSQALGLGMAGIGAYGSLFPGGFSPVTNLGNAGGTGGGLGGLYARGGAIPHRATGGDSRYPLLPTSGAPDAPPMGAGTAQQAQDYSADIDRQAANLAAMSRYSMQPTGTGGWTPSSYRAPGYSGAPMFGSGHGKGSGIFSGLPFGIGKSFSDFFSGMGDTQEANNMPFMQGSQGYADGGGTGIEGSVGDDPFGGTDSFVPNIRLGTQPFKPPELPQPPSMKGSSGGSSLLGDIGTAVGIASKVLPLLMVARGGGVGPFSHHQHFQEGGGDDMTDIESFPFSTGESPIPPSPEDLRPPVPTPFRGWGDAATGAARAGFDWLRPPPFEYATPQEAEQGKEAKDIFAKQVAAIPTGGLTTAPEVEKSPFLPKATRKMTFETAGAATPEQPPGIESGWGNLPAFLRDVPERVNRWAVTPPGGPTREAAMEASPFLPTPPDRPAPEEAAAFKPIQPDQLGADEAQRRAIGAQPETMANVPMPTPRPALTQAPMPPPRPDIAGPAGQAFAGAQSAGPPSRQSVAQDILYYANKHGVPPQLALAIAKQESGFNPYVGRSSAGAIGPMQLMPGTARDLGVNPFNIGQNIEGGIRFLKQMLTRYNGDEKLAAAAYNAGPQRVDNFLAGRGGLPAETQAYVPAVTGAGAVNINQLSAKANTSGAGVPPTDETGTPTTAGAAAPEEIGPSRYTMPASMTPFPQAGAAAPGADLARNPWVMAGLRIAAGTSPWAAVNIGAGASQALEKQRELAEKEVTANQAGQRLYLDTMKHVDTMTRLTPAQEAAGWQMSFDPVHGTPMLFNPRSMKSYTYRDGQWMQSDVGAAMPEVAGAPGLPPGAAPAATPTAIPTPAPQPTPEAPSGASPGGYVAPTQAMVEQYGAGPAFQPKTGAIRPDVKTENEKVNAAALQSADAIRETQRSLNEIESNSDVANKALASASTSGLGRFLLGSGSGADMRFKAAQFLATYGPDELNKQLGLDRNAVGAITEINKEQAYLAANRTRMLGAREAYQVLDLMMKSNPGWEQTPEGRARVINAYKTAIEREKDYQKFLMGYRKLYGNNVAGAQQAFDAANPSQKYVDRANKLAEYDSASNQASAADRVKIYSMPKDRQIEMYDRMETLRRFRGNADVRAAVNKRYNGLADYIMGPQ